MAISLEPAPLHGLDKSNIGIRAHCGACRHFKRLPAPGHGNVTCVTLGAVSEAPACLKFSAEPAALGEALFSVLPALRGLSPLQLRVVASLALEEARRSSKSDTKPLSLGARVFFKPLGDNYLNNYRRAVVCAFEGKRVLLASATVRPFSSARNKPFYAVVAREGVYTALQFSKISSRLLGAGKINDPRTAKLHTITSIKGYTPPDVRTIDGLTSDSGEFGHNEADLEALSALSLSDDGDE